MKANELRIGNLVKHKNHEKPFKVFIIDTTETSFSTNIEPILLTEEWLVKLGFECKDQINGGYTIPINKSLKQSLYCSKRGTYAIIDEFIRCTDIVFTPNIQYVHQLQNLYFALTGEELVCQL